MSGTRITTLDNGLRVVTTPMPALEAASVMLHVGTGARAETAAANGAAHFLEHMAFKGTTQRSGLDIAQEVDAIGGYFNAYTGRETTAYTLKTLRGDVAVAVDILADILQNPLFDPTELERERGVILQEYGQVMDDPDSLLWDRFQATAFPDQPMGRPILGSVENIQRLARDDLKDFMASGYRAGSMVLAAAGAVVHDQIVDLATAAFAALPSGVAPAPTPGRYVGGESRENRACEQVHLALGFPGVSAHSADRFDVSVLACVLGGGMSSRLFQEVREKRGLAYGISAHAEVFSDCGLLSVYAGSGEKETPELIAVICDEITRLADTLRDDEVERARAQFKAAVLMGLDSASARANQQGAQLLIDVRLWTTAELTLKIDAVSKESIASAARRLFAAAPTIAAIGPLGRLDAYDQIQRRLS